MTRNGNRGADVRPVGRGRSHRQQLLSPSIAPRPSRQRQVFRIPKLRQSPAIRRHRIRERVQYLSKRVPLFVSGTITHSHHRATPIGLAHVLDHRWVLTIWRTKPRTKSTKASHDKRQGGCWGRSCASWKPGKLLAMVQESLGEAGPRPPRARLRPPR